MLHIAQPFEHFISIHCLTVRVRCSLPAVLFHRPVPLIANRFRLLALFNYLHERVANIGLSGDGFRTDQNEPWIMDIRSGFPSLLVRQRRK